MAAAISAAGRSLDLIISFSRRQIRYAGYLITRLAFEPGYSGPRQLIIECGITITRARDCPPTDSVASTTRHFLSERKTAITNDANQNCGDRINGSALNSLSPGYRSAVSR